jgi:hypothetical protein
MAEPSVLVMSARGASRPPLGGVERPRRAVRFARLIHRRVRDLGGPPVRAASGGRLSLPSQLLTVVLKRFARSGDMLVAHHGTGCSNEETRPTGGYDGCVERASPRRWPPQGCRRPGWAADGGPRGKRMTSVLRGGNLLPNTPRCFRCAPKRGASWLLLHERWERSTTTTLLPPPAGSAGRLTAYPAYIADVSRLSRRCSRRPNSP